eukprot:501859-Pelagomonas_calceolata.AAC.1
MDFDLAALDAFTRFDVDGKGFLTRHQLKCAFLALFGTKPTKNQLEVFMTGHNGGEAEPCISWHQFRECVQVGPLTPFGCTLSSFPIALTPSKRAPHHSSGLGEHARPK